MEDWSDFSTNRTSRAPTSTCSRARSRSHGAVSARCRAFAGADTIGPCFRCRGEPARVGRSRAFEWLQQVGTLSALRFPPWRTMLLAGMLSTSAAPAAAAQPSAQMFVTRAQRAVADKQLGQAILNFERARLLSPGSDLIARDLAQVRISANLPPSEPRMAGTAAQLLRSDQWGELALVGLLVGAGALFAFVRRVAGRGAFLVIAGLSGLVAAVAFGAAIRNRTP